MAILIAVFQTIVILLAAVAYNVIANALGGILIDVVDTDKQGMPIAAPPSSGSPVPDQGDRGGPEEQS